MLHRWVFLQNGEMGGWTVSETAAAAVLGGALWLRAAPHPQPHAVRQQMYADHPATLSSPRGLDVQPGGGNKVHIRLRNLSPETDGLVSWRYADSPDVDAGRARFTMLPYRQEWQEVTCHIDGKWLRTVDSIAITPLLLGRAGDVWIQSIEISRGPARPRASRPDLASASVVPRVTIPGIGAEDFRDAFAVLDECLIVDVPVHGFPFPVMGPGGAYGENWWQLDSSLNMAGTKWVNQRLVEDMCRGFMAVQEQNPDGRIDLWGGASARGAPADLSSVPRYLETAYDVARRCADPGLRLSIYESMKRYLQWWLSPVKRDPVTGLCTAVGEETFSEEWRDPLVLAPIDLNVAVAVGCRNTAALAHTLGREQEAERFTHALGELRASITTFLWDADAGFYHNYDCRLRARTPTLLSTTFEPFALGMAPAGTVERLLPRLLDPALFNWGGVCLTSIAKTDPRFVEATGPYDGRAWYGDVWTMRNMPVIAGLVDIGRHDLAAELAWMTIRAFSGRYAEYLVPSTGSAEGVQRYGWSASQYIQCIIECLFGVDHDAVLSRVRVAPRVPRALLGETLSLAGLLLPGAGRMSLRLSPGGHGGRRVEVDIQDDAGAGLRSVTIVQPWAASAHLPRATDLDTGGSLPVFRDLEGLRGTAGVLVPARASVRVEFGP